MGRPINYNKIANNFFNEHVSKHGLLASEKIRNQLSALTETKNIEDLSIEITMCKNQDIGKENKKKKQKLKIELSSKIMIISIVCLLLYDLYVDYSIILSYLLALMISFFGWYFLFKKKKNRETEDIPESLQMLSLYRQRSSYGNEIYDYEYLQKNVYNHFVMDEGIRREQIFIVTPCTANKQKYTSDVIIDQHGHVKTYEEGRIVGYVTSLHITKCEHNCKEKRNDIF